MREALVAGWVIALVSVVAGAVAASGGHLAAVATAWLVVQTAAGVFCGLRLRTVLDRAAKIDPDQLAEHPGIDTFQIIVRKGHE